MDYQRAVFIGRFQPFHNAHREIALHGLDIAEKLIIVVGSCNAAPSIRNPWDFEIRKMFIRASLPADLLPRVSIIGVRDYFYSNSVWLSDVQSKLQDHIQAGMTVALLGNFKDASSYYLNCFPQWELVTVRTKESHLDSTKIRKKLFDREFKEVWGDHGEIAEVDFPKRLSVAPGVANVLKTWSETPSYLHMLKEYQHIKRYKDQWTPAPFPPTFVTTDAVVICSGHVLVVRRKHSPGKKLWALPGGFIRQQEFIEDACIRELREETGIRLAPDTLKSKITDSRVFDYPERSLRGRTITHAYLIKLWDGELPEVKSGSDADKAFWIPLMDVAKHEDKFFEDHAHIINYFINKA